VISQQMRGWGSKARRVLVDDYGDPGGVSEEYKSVDPDLFITLHERKKTAR